MLVPIIHHHTDGLKRNTVLDSFIHTLKRFAPFHINILTDIGAKDSQFVVHDKLAIKWIFEFYSTKISILFNLSKSIPHPHPTHNTQPTTRPPLHTLSCPKIG